MTTLSSLTPRQRDVANGIGDGLSYSQIAAKLSNLRSFRREQITARTVQMHVTTIATKIGEDDFPPKIRVMLWVRAQRKARVA
jgi:DNA-binding CsgD family transcriptional regulator